MEVCGEARGRNRSFGGVEGLDVFRDEKAGERGSGERGEVGDGAERAAGVGALRSSVHVQQLGRSDEDDQSDAEERKQNP